MMKKTAKQLACLLVASAGALSVSSCDYFSCLTAENTQDCVIGKSLEKAIAYLADGGNIDTAAKADSFASTWSKVQTIITNAQSFGVKMPDSVKTSYNDTLARMAKHNYFNSAHLKQAMASCKYID